MSTLDKLIEEFDQGIEEYKAHFNKAKELWDIAKELSDNAPIICSSVEEMRQWREKVKAAKTEHDKEGSAMFNIRHKLEEKVDEIRRHLSEDHWLRIVDMCYGAQPGNILLRCPFKVAQRLGKAPKEMRGDLPEGVMGFTGRDVIRTLNIHPSPNRFEEA